MRPPRRRPLDGDLRALAGSAVSHDSVFEAIDRPARIALRTTEHRPDRPSFDFSIEFTFEERDGKTLMTIVQSGFPTDELRDEHGIGVPTAVARFERVVRASLQ